MKYELIQGDCLEKMKDIPDHSIDMILCDLPYGITHCNWDSALPLDQLWKEYKRIVKLNGNVLLFGVQPFLSDVISSNRKDFNCIWVWIKNTKTGAMNARKQPMRRIEEIAVFIVNRPKIKGNSKSPTYNPQGLIKLEKPKKEKNYRKSVYNGASKPHYYTTYTNWPDQLLYYDVDYPKLHSTQKPVDLLNYLVRTYSNEGETVLDTCMGSGSTGVARIQTNRNFIGMELNEEIFQVAKDRIGKAYKEAQEKET